MKLRITETFVSLQGEARDSGYPTLFIRLTGCPLRCGYCDTEYAFTGGQNTDIDDLCELAGQSGVQRVCVTGGEPLAQKHCIELLQRLCDDGFSVSLETSGAIDVTPVDARVRRVMDIKTPGSGEVERNLWANLEQLDASDEAKFVLCDRADYDWAVEQIARYDLAARCPVLFSPSHGQLAPATLADWIVEDRLPVRFQTQLHKQLWGEVAGR